jgi:hypothetical protein
MENLYVFKLHSNIDLNMITKTSKRQIKHRLAHKSNFKEDQEIVYTILHRFSNYENIIWSMYQNNNREFVHQQLNHILVEISKLDSSLTWACMKIFKRYKREYNSRKKRSSYVENISYQSVEL